jgi:hypothetical protein
MAHDATPLSGPATDALWLRWAEMPPDIYDRFRAVLAEELRRRELENSMREHKAEVAELLRGAELDWAAAAQHFARAGLPVDGAKPEAATAEATWHRVSRSGTSTRRRASKQ